METNFVENRCTRLHPTDEDEKVFLDRMGWLRQVEIGWEKNSRKEHRDKLALWMEEPGMKEFASEARVRYLKDEIKWWNGHVKELDVLEREMLRSDAACLTPIVEKKIDESKSKLHRYKTEKKAIMTGANGEITELMIANAREYPIEQIVPVGRSGRAKCVFHDGKDENMDIRKNYAFCYVCNRSGDAIDVYRAVYGVGFKQAVQALSGITTTL